jgi:hypothetical protein
MKVAGVLIQALFIMVLASLFYKSFRRLPLDDGLATIKTLGFWGLCALVVVLQMIFIGLNKTKGEGLVIATSIASILTCCLAYGLLFTK